MKRIVIYIICITGLSSLMACKKYLDTLPDNRTVITTPDQVSKLLVNAYPKKSYVLFTEALSDNAEDKQNSGLDADPEAFKINTQAFKYEDVQSNLDDSPIGYFYACYKAIAVANQALAYCNNADSAKYRAQKGEALLCRAYAHFMLVTLFAKAYDPATSTTDPGIPYVTTVETNVFAKYDRKTVQYVYDMINNDLQTGLPLLDEKTYGDAPKYHFNLKAAYAFASRYYLFKTDYAKVITYSDLVLGSTPAVAIRNQQKYKNMQREVQIASYTLVSEPANLLLQEATTKWNNESFPYFRFGMGDKVHDKFFKNANATGGTFNTIVYGGTNQFYNMAKFNTFGSGTSIMPLLTGDEVLFNRAEAKLKLGKLTEGLNDLDIWVGVNMTGSSGVNIVPFYKQPYTIAGQTTAMLMLALDLKQEAYLQEGLRWLDILRLKIPVTHLVKGIAPIQLTADDNRKMLQLPLEAQSAGMPLNPR